MFQTQAVLSGEGESRITRITKTFLFALYGNKAFRELKHKTGKVIAEREEKSMVKRVDKGIKLLLR